MPTKEEEELDTALGKLSKSEMSYLESKLRENKLSYWESGAMEKEVDELRMENKCLGAMNKTLSFQLEDAILEIDQLKTELTRRKRRTTNAPVEDSAAETNGEAIKEKRKKLHEKWKFGARRTSGKMV